MHCAHCGKEIGDKHKCSCCGAAQHSDDLFAVLGDLGPNTNDGRMESVVNEPIASITYGDYYSELGDIPTNEDCSLIMQADNTASENVSSTDPFHVLGNLDGSPNLLDDTGMDAPATGGFKPMDELVPSNDGQEETEETENRDPTVTFVWKKWMAIAASIAFIFVILISFHSNLQTHLSNSQAETMIRDELMIVMNYEKNSSNPVISTLVEGLEIDITSVEKKGSDYILECTFKNYDIATAFAVTNQQTGEITLNEYMNILTQEMKSTQKIENTLTVSASYLQSDDRYNVQLTEHHLDAAMGGFISAVTQ